MPYFASFDKDWESTKKELEKLGHHKPTETKTLIGSLGTRLSSGIGKALKEVDSCKPKDENHPSEEEVKKFEKTVKPLRKAVESELIQIQGVINGYKGYEEKVAKELKDGYYRALKVFKTKLEHYVAAAEAQLVQYQTAIDKKSTEAQKAIQKFKAETKERLTKTIVSVKEILLKPNEQALSNAYSDLVKSLQIVHEQAEHIDTKLLSYSNVMCHSLFYNLYITVLNWKGAVQAKGDELVKVAASALVKYVKEGIEILGKTGNV